MSTVKFEDFEIEIMPHEIWLLNNTPKFIKTFSGPLDVVVDLGAHIGIFTLTAAKHGAKHIYAVEPSPTNQAALRTNLQVNNYADIVTILPFAVWDSNGDRILRRAGVSQGQLSLNYRSTFRDESVVPTVAFADLINNIGPIDYLKMDIEGGEYFALSPTDAVREAMRKVAAMELELHDPNDRTYFSPEWFNLHNSYYDALSASDQLHSFIESCGFDVLVTELGTLCKRKD